MEGTRGTIEEDEKYVHSCSRLHSRSLDLNWRTDVNMPIERMNGERNFWFWFCDQRRI